MLKRFLATSSLLVLLFAVGAPQGAFAARPAGGSSPSAASARIASSPAAAEPTSPEVRFFVDENWLEIRGCPSDTTLTVTLGSAGVHKDLKTGASGSAVVSAENLGMAPTPLIYCGEPVSIVSGGVIVKKAVVQDIDARVDAVHDRVDGTALAPDGTPLAGRAIEVTILDELGDEVATKTGTVGSDGSFVIGAGVDLLPGQSVQTRVWHLAGGVTTGDSTVRGTAIPISSALSLSAKKPLATFGAPATLSAKLSVGGKPVVDTGDPDDPFTVGLLQSYDGVNWSPAGALEWDEATRSFVGMRIVTQAVQYRAFFEHVGHRDVTSGVVALTSQASLSQPQLSASSPKRNAKFSVTGYLKTVHTGSPLVVYVYRKVGAKWVQYSKVAVKGVAFGSGTKHALTLSLATAGQWMVQTYHADHGHIATRSKATTFTVRP